MPFPLQVNHAGYIVDPVCSTCRLVGEGRWRCVASIFETLFDENVKCFFVRVKLETVVDTCNNDRSVNDLLCPGVGNSSPLKKVVS